MESANNFFCSLIEFFLKTLAGSVFVISTILLVEHIGESKYNIISLVGYIIGYVLMDVWYKVKKRNEEWKSINEEW